MCFVVSKHIKAESIHPPPLKAISRTSSTFSMAALALYPSGAIK